MTAMTGELKGRTIGVPYVTAVGLGGLAIIAIALALRLWVIETPESAWACQAADGVPWWCPVRLIAIRALQAGVLGIISLVAGIAAIAGGGRRLAAAAILFGAAGLVLYSAGPAAVGLLLGAIRAVRL